MSSYIEKLGYYLVMSRVKINQVANKSSVSKMNRFIYI